MFFVFGVSAFLQVTENPDVETDEDLDDNFRFF